MLWFCSTPFFKIPMIKLSLLLVLIIIMIIQPDRLISGNKVRPVHRDKPFLQDYSVKYYNNNKDNTLSKVRADRNGVIQILSNTGIFKPFGGSFLYPGTIDPDKSYRTMAKKKLISLDEYNNQLVYLDQISVLSNAWAGKLFSKHEMKDAKLFTGGKEFAFLVSNGKNLVYLQDSKRLWEGKAEDQVIQLRYTEETDLFWILGKNSLSTYSPASKKLTKIFEGKDFTCFDLVAFNTKTIIGTSNGYLEINNISKTQMGQIKRELPVTEITAVEEVNGNVWFGTTLGAFMVRPNGGYNYYNGERWLPGNAVKDISKGPDNSVLILSDKGLGQIFFKEMTLEEKALYFEQQVRLRHIRNGFNASWDGLKHGNLSTGYLSDSDNDGLWTSMYLGGESFRYALTKSQDAF